MNAKVFWCLFSLFSSDLILVLFCACPVFHVQKAARITAGRVSEYLGFLEKGQIPPVVRVDERTNLDKATHKPLGPLPHDQVH